MEASRVLQIVVNTGDFDFVATLRGVTQRYGDVIAVDGVHLGIPARKMIGLMGPDGVGKSTILGMISGVRRIQQGEVVVLGGNIADARFRGSVCARVAYMPQGLGKNLYPTLSIFENVDFFGRLFGQSREEREWRINDLLASTGLAPFRDRPAGKLSGGMKQKLGLCCSLIHEPDLLILDEPTTGVDPLSRRQFWELIDRIKSRHSTLSVLVATAYMDEAERFDWLVAMNAGKVLASGTPEEIKRGAGETTLERAFIRLLPEELRSGHKEPEITPRHEAAAVPAIEATGLTQRFGTFTAVDHVSFRIERGEIFGFLGSNGCGKTTTMKMLTGLLPPTEGRALLFGQPVRAGDMEIRRRVGFMSQAFSLYTELTVRQNLELHARLFDLPSSTLHKRVDEMIGRFGLESSVDTLAESLPLGIRQRLSLAVAVVHEPEMLILDEPTSGVDPVARDGFWELLIQLSRENGVTIFISTHFMNEAERCDRISLMHAGKVLAQGTPAELKTNRKLDSLEEVFLAYLEEAAGASFVQAETAIQEEASLAAQAPHDEVRRGFSLGRLWAFARREAVELRHDYIRLAFALLGPIVLMIVFGYGISLDIEHLPFAVFDEDGSPASRDYADSFRGAVSFDERPELHSSKELDRRLRSGELRFAVEIPPGFGKDLQSRRSPEVGAWLDAAVPFRAEITRGYVEGVNEQYPARLSESKGVSTIPPPVNIEPRFRYNQEFKSVYAMVPADIMLILILIPAMMTALSVVREKEMGSIANFYAAPATKSEFLLGKQLPYFSLALVNSATLILLAILLFKVPLKGSWEALAAGSVIYVLATTAFGILMSVFSSTQTAAIFAAAIITILPAQQFSGMLVPVSSLASGARLMGSLFPSAYFQRISVGTFTKAIGFAALSRDFIAIGVIFLLYFGSSVIILAKQER